MSAISCIEFLVQCSNVGSYIISAHCTRNKIIVDNAYWLRIVGIIKNIVITGLSL